MKQLIKIFTVLVLALTWQGLFAQITEYQFDNGKSKEGFVIEKATRSGLSISHSLKKISVEDISDNGYSGQQLHINEITLPSDAGNPNLPTNSRYIAIPNGSTPVLEVKNFKSTVLKDMDIMAAAPILSDTDDRPATYEKNPDIYNKNAFYPEEPFTISEVMTIRGVQVVVVSVTPFQYNPVTKEVIVYHDIDLELSFKGGNGEFGEERYRSRYFDPILQNVLLNYDQLPVIDYESRMREWSNNRPTGCEYLIVIPNNESFRPIAEELAEYRIKQGILTQVMSLDDMECTTTAQLKSFFHNAYNTWDIPPVAVLLFGDHNTNMSSGIPAEVVTHITEGTCITDNQYADVTNDHLPEMCFSRLVAANATEAQLMVDKTINYEYNNPNMDSYSYQNPITALGWQTERWFQICSEVVGGYWREQGKTPVRINAIYQGTPGNIWSTAQNTATVTNYFGQNGLGYLPTSPTELGGWSGGTASQVITAINNGAFIVQHRDHGYEQGWGEPSFSVNNINQLTNTDKLTFVMTINCLTGKFNYSSNCLAEAFMRRTYNGQGAGAVGAICPTEVSFSFVNDVFVWGMYDLFDPNFMPSYGPYADYSGNWMPAFGNVAGKYFLAQSSWPYNNNCKDVTYQMFTAHCDAFLRLYTTVPQELNVSHDDEVYDGEGIIHVTAPAGSFIAITKNGNTILATAEATGNNQTISFTPQSSGTTLDIVITKQDYLRYVDQVEVVNNRPVLDVLTFSINDENNNGQLDYDESASFNFTIKNNGGVPSSTTSATLTTTSTYITINNPNATINSINSGQQINVNDIFQISSSDNMPDNYVNRFNLQMVSGDYSWQYQFNVTGYAPNVNIMKVFEIVNDDNSNQRLDENESGVIRLQLINNGHSSARSITSALSTTSPFVNITENTATTTNLNVGQSAYIEYNVSTENNIPMGEIANFTLNSSCASYTAENDFYTRMNLPIETFESGDLSQFEWMNDETHPWTISETSPYSGNYCLKSGAINNNESSVIEIEIEVTENDTLSFMRKVSSEANGDFFKFYIDNEEIESTSGANNWRNVNTPISQGTHIIKFEYVKNASGSSNDDCAYIDFVIFPPIIRTSCSAGSDMTLCHDENAELNGIAYGYESITWTTNGDGQFNNASVLNPVYTPGTQDIDNGNVTLTLTVTGSGTTVSDDINIIIWSDPVITMDNEAFVCYNETYATTAEAEFYDVLTWTTNGDGYFDDISSLNTYYHPGTQDISNGNVVLTLTIEGCDNASSEITLNITDAPIIEIEETMSICGDNPVNITATAENIESLSWTTDGDGTFNDANTLEPIYFPGVQDLANGNVELTLTAEGCNSTVTKTITLTAHPLPTLQVLTSEIETCLNQDIDIQLALTGVAPFEVKIEGQEETYEVGEDAVMKFRVQDYNITEYYITDIYDANGCHAEINESFSLIVLQTPETPSRPTGETIVNLDETLVYTYSVLPAANTETYRWILEPETAGSVAGNGNVASITWNTDATDTATLSVVAINSICGESAESEPLEIFLSHIGLDENLFNTLSIYPNPSDDIVNIKMEGFDNSKALIYIYNVLGEQIYAREESAGPEGISTQIDISNFSKGVYIFRIITGNDSYIKNIIVK